MNNSQRKLSLGINGSICISLGGNKHIPIATSSKNEQNILKDFSSEYRQRFIFVSDCDIVHIEGNSLRKSCLWRVHTKSSSQVSATDTPNFEIWAGLSSLGFSCHAYCSQRDLLAYSERKPNPEILVVSYPQRRKICIISGFAANEYTSLAFSRDGTRIAGLGFGNIDKQIWIWKVDQQSSSTHNSRSEEREKDASSIPSKGLLVASINLRFEGMTCMFNPYNFNEVAVLSLHCSELSVYRINSVILNLRVRDLK